MGKYLTAVMHLSMNNNITITSSDKGGGVNIMDSTYYKNKIMELLNVKNKFFYQP